MSYLFRMSDAQLDHAVEAYYDKLYRDAYERPEPHCRDCYYFCRGSHECEQRYDEDTDTFEKVEPDGEVCKLFDAYEDQDEPDYD